MINSFLLKNSIEIYRLCKQHSVSKLYAFGSIVDGRFVEGKSDIDLLIEFDEKTLSKKDISKSLLLLWIEFQRIFKCNVDLISNAKLKGKYFKKYLDMYKIKIFDMDEVNTDNIKSLTKV